MESAAAGRPVKPRPDLAARLLSPRPFPHEIAAAVYVVAGIAVLERLPVTYPRLGLLLAGWRPMAWAAVPALVAILVRRAVRRKRGLAPGFPAVAEAAIFARAAMVLVPVLSVHFMLKSFIYLVNSRTWDAELWNLDRTAHLGISPSLFLTGLFASPNFLNWVDLAYSSFYFFLVAGTIPVLLLLPSPSRRMAFLAAYMFIWIVGSILYLALPSWGPVFVVPNVFSDTLQHMPATVRVQEELFRELSSLVRTPLAPRFVYFGCVGAFPSLHVAVVTIFTVASRSVSRRWFQVNVGITALILLGSVLTGYHYLLDGWAGIALGWGVCALGRWLFPDPAAA